MDRKLTIFFIIGREEKRGHKEVDHILPILYLLNEREDIHFSAKGVIFGYKSIVRDKTDFRLKLLHDIKNVNIIDLYYINKNLFFKKIIKWIEDGEKSIFKKIIERLILLIYRNADNKINWKSVVGEEFITSKMPIIITLNINYSSIIQQIKKLNANAKWIVVPHGTTISDNKMLHINHMDRNESSQLNPKLKEMDYYLFTSKRDLEDAVRAGFNKDKGYIIGSPRFCNEWMTKKQQLRLDGPSPKNRESAKVKFLFLIPKHFINIFDGELLRTIDFISKYDEIDLILNRASKFYPKIPNRILNRPNIRDYLISKEYLTGALMDWADVVIHVGTGVIFESFIKKKITVFPRYLTCNTLICEKYNAGWTLKNRDELRELCNMAVNSISDTRDKYFRDYGSANEKYIDDFVNGNSKSVIDNIIKIINQLCN